MGEGPPSPSVVLHFSFQNSIGNIKTPAWHRQILWRATCQAVEIFNKLSLPLISYDITLVSKQCIINIWLCNTEEWNTALHLHTDIHQNCACMSSHPKNSQRKAVVIIRIWRWKEKEQTHQPALYPLQTRECQMHGMHLLRWGVIESFPTMFAFKFCKMKTWEKGLRLFDCNLLSIAISQKGC